jgi:hypothetical protein
VTMQDALCLTDHLARDAGLIVNSFLQHSLSHGRWAAKQNDTGLLYIPPTTVSELSSDGVTT